VEKQLGSSVKKLRSDRGGEYRSKEADAYFKENDIIAETTASYSPQSNRIAERKNHTLTEMVNSMLITSSLPTCYWGEAILMANWILNRVPYFKTETTPHQLWLGYSALLDNLKVWGCLAYVRIPDIRRPKLGQKANKCAFLGFAEDSGAYRFLDLGTNSIIEARDAEFFEDKFIKDKNLTLKDIPTTQGPEDSVPTTSVELVPPEDEGIDADHTEQTPEDVEPPSKRINKQKNFGDDFITYNVEGG
jgi:hypothetical protein